MPFAGMLAKAADTQALPEAAVQALAEIPGVGWMTALTLSLRVDASHFKSGCHLAAWIGLTPRVEGAKGRRC